MVNNNIAKLYYYKILGENLNEDKSKFFFYIKKNVEKNIPLLKFLLINYKSYCNLELTKFYLDTLDNEVKYKDYIDKILYYLTNNVYCCLLKYVNFLVKIKKQGRDAFFYRNDKRIEINFEGKVDLDLFDIDFGDNTVNNFEYIETKYTKKEIESITKIIAPIKYFKYDVKNDLITENTLDLREFYLLNSIKRKLIE